MGIYRHMNNSGIFDFWYSNLFAFVGAFFGWHYLYFATKFFKTLFDKKAIPFNFKKLLLVEFYFGVYCVIFHKPGTLDIMNKTITFS